MTAFGETHIAIHYQGWILLHVNYTLKPGEKALRGSVAALQFLDGTGLMSEI